MEDQRYKVHSKQVKRQTPELSFEKGDSVEKRVHKLKIRSP